MDMRRIAAAFAAIAACLLLSACARPADAPSERFSSLSDLAAPGQEEPESATAAHGAPEAASQDSQEPEPGQLDVQAEPQSEGLCAEPYVEPCEDLEPPAEGLVEQAGPGGVITKEGGVNEYGGTTETWYSSNVQRHCRTDEWELDEEGFYRTGDGYYVVASSDLEEGTVIETSKGEAMVLDSGCDPGVVDFYVGW